MSAPWMLIRLVLETREHHARADADRLALMDVGSPSDYRRILARIYGFEMSVEERLDVVPGLGPHVFAQRKKSQLLAQDLEALGMSSNDVRALPRCHAAIRSPAQALGWLFTIERLMLVSNLIRRHLAATQPNMMQNASRYLSAYGDAAGSRFTLFGEDCCFYARRSVTEPTAMVLAANYAFEVQRNWYSRLRTRPTDVPEPRDAA